MPARNSPEAKRQRCRRKFLRYFPEGFQDGTYLDWERDYKAEAHDKWNAELGRAGFRKLLDAGEHEEIAARAVRIESRTNLLFSFEKMALRDAVKSAAGAQRFSEGLFDYVYGTDILSVRFDRFTETIEALPRKQTRVLTWPLHTVFGFIARPDEHMFLKPRVTMQAAAEYAFDFPYTARPNWATYRSLLDFAEQVRHDQADLKPRDYIDLQSFIWVLGSDEYP